VVSTLLVSLAACKEGEKVKKETKSSQGRKEGREMRRMERAGKRVSKNTLEKCYKTTSIDGF